MSTQINFYILPSSEESKKLEFCARLVEKVFSKEHRVLIVCDSGQQLEALDKLLWSFKEESFIPHLISDEITAETRNMPIVLTLDSNYKMGAEDVCISMSHQVVQQFECFSRFLEITNQNKDALAESREHYKFYRQKGYEITTHKI
tara:strand:- start:45 stop:482 length:438 start_codon:yes stop_codon:yes gene_type:complete